MPQRPIWVDGALVPWDHARISVLSHSLQRGSLVFDLGAMRQRKDGRSVLFRPHAHIERFLRSARLAGLKVPQDATTLLAATVGTARASHLTSALVRWSAFIATPEPDVVARADTHVSVAIAIYTPEDFARPGESAPKKPPAFNILIPRDVRKAGPEVLSPQIKAAGAYLCPMLAKRRALTEGFDEVVLLDREGRVAEAPTANVFAVRGGALVTPPLERVLAGITRDAVQAIARAEGLATQEAHLTPEELARADEAFLTSTSLPLMPIASVDRQPLGGGAPGPVTARIAQALAACERGEDARFSDWTLVVE